MGSNESNSETPKELFVQLLTKYDPELRAFIRGSLPSPHDTAEVMQNVSLIAWKKFGELENPETDFAKWACVIARYEILKFRRSLARDRIQLADDIIERLCAEGAEEVSLRVHQREHLEHCLGKLPTDRRALVMQCYSPGASIKSIAERRNRSPNALYLLLRRIRQELEACIERRMKQQEVRT